MRGWVGNWDYLFSVCVLGEQSVGKTSLIYRLTNDTFEDGTSPTIGVEFSDKIINVDGTNIKVQMWDTTGDPRYRSTTKQMFRGKAACLLTFDICSRPTFERLSDWIHDLRELTHPQAKIVLIGNKADLQVSRQVSKSEAEEFAATHGLTYFETSCKTGQNIDACFTIIAKELLHGIRTEFYDLENEALGISSSRRSLVQAVLLSSQTVEKVPASKQKSKCC